ncbi:MAG: ABC transporter permease subunit [Lachnospiraceae bacterium]|nr:ABC transporter permease subunit [Lachnospiraceae bacterium]
MKAIFERELKVYFTNVSGYIFGIFVLIFAGIYTMVINLKAGYPNFEVVLSNMSFIFPVAVPLLTMRSIAEERRQKTDQLLYSLPISMTKVILGKYLAMLIVILVPIIVMCAYPLILSQYGAVNFKAAYGSLLGFFFLAGTLASIGIFVSSLTENQAVAAGLCFTLMLLLYFLSALADTMSASAASSFIALVVIVFIVSLMIQFITKNTLVSASILIILEAVLLAVYVFMPTKLEGLVPGVLNKLSLFERFYTFTDGVFDITSLVYFLTMSGVFIFLSVQSLEKRRWS